ncbi:nucleoside deaminase [Simiduia agarivorans]|nr:nucleoside deaminase [Simiduia agarivorans]
MASVVFVFSCSTANLDVKEKHDILFSQSGVLGEENNLSSINNAKENANSYEIEKRQEIDDIYLLLAMSVVYKNWQSVNVLKENRRGHNIGGVLVGPDLKPIFWARNARHATKNASQHAEVRIVSSYLMCPGTPSYLANNYTLYSSLEPCLMCTGMLSLTRLDRAVFAQKDTGYGDVDKRLLLDTSNIGGYSPYPNVVQLQSHSSGWTNELNAAYKSWKLLDRKNISITDWLLSDNAEIHFRKSEQRLLNYRSEYENEDILSAAINYLQLVTVEFEKDLSKFCPE